MADDADHIGETLIAERRFGSLEDIVSERPGLQQFTRRDVHHPVGAVREIRLFTRVDGLDDGPVKSRAQRDRSLRAPGVSGLQVSRRYQLNDPTLRRGEQTAKQK